MGIRRLHARTLNVAGFKRLKAEIKTFCLERSRIVHCAPAPSNTSQTVGPTGVLVS
jgi:hypothetical protein